MRFNFFLSLLAATLPMLGQLPAPNQAGVSAGHEHFTVHDLEAATRFWTTLGGVPAQLGQIKLIKFPGVFIMLRQGEPKDDRTTVMNLGFKVKNLTESLARWELAGVKPQSVAKPNAYLTAPDNVTLKITEDPSLAAPIASDTLEISVSNVAEAQAWYAKWFGANPVKHGRQTVGDIPGSNLTFSETKGTLAGTKGHSLDHIGFEVKNLEDLCKKFEAAGIKLDLAYRKPGNVPLSVAFVTDPWGTYIELNEGFAAVQ
jgi:catechol 2,3-dioxygenase-like lactoylglutathione lyase family enzyme